MDKVTRMKMKGMNNEDIFAIYTEYVRDSVSRDLREIYREKVHLVDPEEPWVFRVENN